MSRVFMPGVGRSAETFFRGPILQLRRRSQTKGGWHERQLFLSRSLFFFFSLRQRLLYFFSFVLSIFLGGVRRFGSLVLVLKVEIWKNALEDFQEKIYLLHERSIEGYTSVNQFHDADTVIFSGGFDR